MGAGFLGLRIQALVSRVYLRGLGLRFESLGFRAKGGSLLGRSGGLGKQVKNPHNAYSNPSYPKY